MARLRLVLFFLLFSASFASAQWQLQSQSQPTPLGHDAWQVRKSINGPAQVELNLVFFNAKRCTLQILDQPDPGKARSLGQAIASTPAIAGCNGGYFTPAFAPLGLVISSAGRAGSFQRSSLLGGLIQVRKGRPMLLWRDEFAEVPGISNLLQAGPRLVNGGIPIKGLETTRQRARTFVLTDNNGRWVIGVSSRISLHHLGQVLAAKGIITELSPDRALNLDGGSSSALWWKEAAGMVHYEREYAIVRNFLIVVPRN